MKFSITGIFIASLFILGVVFSSSCKKQQFLTNGGELKFSTDTLSFDTVFTAVASFTLNVKIKNPQGQKVNISSVRLGKGINSFFNLNVNGFPGNNITNIEVAANDSIYVYATVNIDPNNDNIPFIIEDKLIATMNGKEFSIPMYAYGQNAHYIKDSTITQNDTWLKDKPYVIVHGVAIDMGVTLTIPAGARIYMNADTRMFVLGKLIAKGTDSIIFQGDRLDRGYFGGVGYPGEWGGIYFAQMSKGSEMDWCILRNCGNNAFGTLAAGIQVTGDNNTGTDTQLTITHSIIANSIGYGVVAFQGNISMENCLVHSTGAQALAIFEGGNYRFTNCDFINYFPARVSHTDNPTAAILNYRTTGDGPNDYVSGDLHAVLSNCLIYGSLEEEIVSLSRGTKAFDVRINNCLLKTSGKSNVLSPNIVFTGTTGSVVNKDPQFKDYKKEDFRAKDNTSPLVDSGAGSTKSNKDLDDNNRTNGVIDIGCYEF